MARKGKTGDKEAIFLEGGGGWFCSLLFGGNIIVHEKIRVIAEILNGEGC